MQFFNKVYFAADGEVSGVTTETTNTTDEVVFTPAQQSAIEKIIARVSAQAKRSAAKSVQEQVDAKVQEQVDAKDAELQAAKDALETEKASLAAERA